MAEFLLAAALLVFLTMLAGLIRVLRGPSVADRIMAAALLGTGGIAVLILAGAATGVAALSDLALTFAVLAAFASVAMARTAPRPDGEGGEGP